MSLMAVLEERKESVAKGELHHGDDSGNRAPFFGVGGGKKEERRRCGQKSTANRSVASTSSGYLSKKGKEKESARSAFFLKERGGRQMCSAVRSVEEYVDQRAQILRRKEGGRKIGGKASVTC